MSTRARRTLGVLFATLILGVVATGPLGAQSTPPDQAIRLQGGKPLSQILLELTVGVDIDGMTCGGNGRGSVLAKIEARDGHRLFRFPVTDAKVSLLMFLKFCPGGDQAKLAWPAQEEVIGGKIRAVPQVRVPAFSRADV